ncbi:MAG TPA: PP2C family protein-serine/threonine phosphatase, partial [Thermoanaerobaculia bacterium]|nr:PP2C family protein-serine/threonine phosphatase [Thermoanaerobaculia bacterium]
RILAVYPSGTPSRLLTYNRPVAELHDWVELGKDTISSLKTKDVTNLYALEWPETRKMLIADYQSKIDADPRRLRRFVRTRSAMLLGLAKRLTPQRRVVFLVAFVWFFFCFFDALSWRSHFRTSWQLFEMAASFMLMVLLLAMELIDKIKFRDELELARDLQADLIPKHPPQTEEYEIAAFNRIANTVGGDIYDFVPLPDGRLAVLFGDASGHGMAAGLVMAVAHAAWRTQLDVDPSPASIISSLNRILCRTGGPRSFFSCCYFLFDRDGTFIATVAGHPQIVKIAAGKVIDRIGSGSYPLGVKTGMVWQEINGSLDRGERLLFHSDGLTEARNANEREFGDSYVDTIAGWNTAASAAALVDTLVCEWNLFTGGKPPEDDVSIAVIARR